MDSADWQVRTTTTFRWRDFNGNGIYDAGESNLNTNGADFISQSGGSNFVPSPDERQPKSDEVSLSVERELAAEFRRARQLRLLALSRYLPHREHAAPVRRLQRPGDPAGSRVPTACSATPTIPASTSPTTSGIRALNGRAFERFARVNDPTADQTYNSIDIALSKRLSHNWQLTASYSATKRDVPLIYSDLTAPATTASGEFNGNVESAPLTPNNEINAARPAVGVHLEAVRRLLAARSAS